MDTAPPESKLVTARAVISSAASAAATLMLARSVLQDVLPREFLDLTNFRKKLFSRFSSTLTMVIDDFNGWVPNQVYEAADTYLGSKIVSPSTSTHRFQVSKPAEEDELQVQLEGNQEVTDTFQGVTFKWVLVVRASEATRKFHGPSGIGSVIRSESRSFEVSFHKKHKDLVLTTYLPYIVRKAKLTAQEKKTIKIHTLNLDQLYGCRSGVWASVNLDHPANFETLALDGEVKSMILNDLERFVRRREYYRKVGKAWKRGYLLYGPPGTGKSSLIAAMANKLNFDIYDLELSEIRSNSDLRKLLVATTNRSILVVEDIDCTIELQDRLQYSPSPEVAPHHTKVTLSGFLNFIDGLWSSCGDERIIVFTTNHKDKLDPALLRPGRMDVHVHMSYCTPFGFRTLASNYIGIKDHTSFEKIEELILATRVTPAEVAEQLIRSEEVEKVLNELIEFLEAKRKEQEEERARENDDDDEEAGVSPKANGEKAETAEVAISAED